MVLMINRSVASATLDGQLGAARTRPKTRKGCVQVGGKQSCPHGGEAVSSAIDALFRGLTALLLVAFLAAILWVALGFWIRTRWPARVPDELAFRHPLESTRPLREIAEALARMFPQDDPEIVCLGPVRGSAARMLFHVGPKNRGKNANIHRPDYLLCVRRLAKTRVELVLETNLPYRYLRLRTNEVRRLHEAVTAAFGTLEEL